ncbi:efflux RND transporter permease subunit [Novosphingobium sp. AP12]|uniref:efflux RND transporter permease subunit n=1 Tax=Novosphingobium sp. AP12 TaxID=1144305 RepID=UPI000569C163
MATYFIDRPKLAWVVAIITMLLGLLALRALPVAQFPDLAAPAIEITATYPGADAQTLETTVTQIIEQQMNGLDGLRYIAAKSDASGTATITLTFEQGIKANDAQVQVQNKLQLATALLPPEVQRQGIKVDKAVNYVLLIISLVSADGTHNSTDLGDLLSSRVKDQISRVAGVGQLNLFGAQHAMRVWLDPLKMSALNLSVQDVRAAILAQNAQVSAGQIGARPVARGQSLNVTVGAQSRLTTPKEFERIVLRVNPDQSSVSLRDVARIELGGESYAIESRQDGKPAAALLVKLAPGANSLDTMAGIKARMGQLSQQFPSDVKVVYSFDTSVFVDRSIIKVIETIGEAFVLVFLVMFLFLQSWRATLIPAISVPVVLLGALAALYVTGFTINTLTLFGLVLAIGLLVDDTIVVVENVERLIQEQGMSPAQAARASMQEISGALIGIAVVLSAVFLPMAFFSGSTGVIYRQFSITIATTMLLSVLVALILTPALCASLLKPHNPEHTERRGFFGWFNRTFDRGRNRYDGAVRTVSRRWGRSLVLYGLLCAGLVFLFVRLPTGFLPDEDQGSLFALVSLPANASAEQTDALLERARQHIVRTESANVETVFTATGFSFSGQGENAGVMMLRLKDWEDRKGSDKSAAAIAGRINAAMAKDRAGSFFSFSQPAAPDLGQTTGFDLELMDEVGHGHAKLIAARNALIAAAANDPRLMAVRPNGIEDAPQLKIAVDTRRAAALGVAQADVNDTLASLFGSSYVNDFLDQGRVKKVFLQADEAFRRSPDDLQRIYVRGASGAMAPLSAFAKTSWAVGPMRLERYNGTPSVEILGAPGAGQTTGSAMTVMNDLATKLPAGFNVGWTAQSYEEALSSGRAPMLYTISILIVFLCLVALYESWSVPLAVILVLPCGIFGALLVAWLTGLANDIYFQVALITTVGVTAKNAILIVEFAEENMQAGKTAFDAVREAAEQRLRPILMTSLAFGFGVLPLAFSTGAGAAAQHAIGRGVIGGMLTGTFLTIFFVPVFFMLVQRVFGQKRSAPAVPASPHPSQEPI